MSDPVFFRPALSPSLAEILDWTGAKADPADPAAVISRVAPLDEAGPGDLAFFDNPKYLDALIATRASACLIAERFANRVPPETLALVTPQPYRAFATVLARMYPDAIKPGSYFGSTGTGAGAFVHPQARLEADVTIDPGAVIGPGAEIGSGTTIGPNAVIGAEVRIGRGCFIGAGVKIAHALIGNHVLIHAGAAIGQDGFGFAVGRRGHMKMPQVGRVIIQDDVEIGANTTVDRGMMGDTVIGEGTKIDNLVQIAHNVRIGRHCLIVAQTGISGSTELCDFVSVGGQAGFAGHLHVGAGAQIAGQSGVIADVPEKARLGGTPARAFRDWLRAHVVLDRLAKGPPNKKGKDR
ncbi:MAG: UDP-3-O-(3-hydroxymyristoyl)glucosamine N-acyltransferase [Beijerinckiaceae bacterium]|nr:MAG: UDP-3-O-(3-hydroxymyristoyl)glucosamine N-acyltransferase [Beijerinckiaceae bacterium]